MELQLQNRWKTAGQEPYGRYVHKQEKPMLKPSASHNEYNMYTYVFSRKFGIWHKSSHPPTIRYNWQMCATGSSGKVQYFVYLWPHYNSHTYEEQFYYNITVEEVESHRIHCEPP